MFGLVLETLERLFLESKVAMDNGFKEVDEHSLVATAIVLFENEDGVDLLNKLEQDIMVGSDDDKLKKELRLLTKKLIDLYFQDQDLDP